MITQAKTTPERAWLGEVSAVVLQQALADRRQAVRFTRNARFSITSGGKLRLPKIGDVDVRWSRDLPSEPSSVTVIRDAAGRYFASFVVEASDEPLPETTGEVGVDLGLTHFAVLSDGRKIDNPRCLRRGVLAGYGSERMGSRNGESTRGRRHDRTAAEGSYGRGRGRRGRRDGGRGSRRVQAAQGAQPRRLRVK